MTDQQTRAFITPDGQKLRVREVLFGTWIVPNRLRDRSLRILDLHGDCSVCLVYVNVIDARRVHGGHDKAARSIAGQAGACAW